MMTRGGGATAVGCTILIAGALLACKKGSSSSSGPSSTTAATATASAAAAPAAPTDKIYKEGETATATDYKLTLEKVEECKPKSVYFKPKKGTIWLGAQVTIQSTTSKTTYPSSANFKITDGEGVVHNVSYSSSKNCDPALSGSQLAQGEKLKGWVIFELPTAASGLKLTYNPISFGQPQTSKFDLGR
ncbi:MAG: DUF4352 domain-containing protein [Polyangiaceae bacterium]|nr:DUF4352 domain-containing protein [Polyangiaceae bacterium]